MGLHFASQIVIANTINIEVAWFDYSMLHAQNPTLSGNNIFLRHSVYSVYPLKRQPTEPMTANIICLSVFIFMMYFYFVLFYGLVSSIPLHRCLEVWNWMISKVPSNSGHSMILYLYMFGVFYFIFTLYKVRAKCREAEWLLIGIANLPVVGFCFLIWSWKWTSGGENPAVSQQLCWDSHPQLRQLGLYHGCTRPKEGSILIINVLILKTLEVNQKESHTFISVAHMKWRPGIIWSAVPS